MDNQTQLPAGNDEAAVVKFEGGNALFDRVMAFDYVDRDRSELMRKVLRPRNLAEKPLTKFNHQSWVISHDHRNSIRFWCSHLPGNGWDGVRMVDVGESGTVKARPPVSELVDELFSKVEGDQGHGFFSDGEGIGLTHQQYFEHVRTRLRHNEKAVKIIKRFLRKYGEL